MTATKFHRMSETEAEDCVYLFRGGYVSDCGDWVIARCGYSWQVWQRVIDEAVSREGDGLPWFIDNPYAAVDNYRGSFYVHRWDSATYGDAKVEISMVTGI